MVGGAAQLLSLGGIYTMRVLRIVLLLFISFWLFLMAGCPGMYDSHRTAVAYHHYFDNKNDETRYEVDAALKLDRRDIFVYEIIMAAILATAIYGFIRAGRKTKRHDA